MLCPKELRSLLLALLQRCRVGFVNVPVVIVVLVSGLRRRLLQVEP